jgi:transcriptional regulator with XRE-family HTH domain
MHGAAFGERLRDARKRADLTQQQLAEASGVSVSAIRKLEQGLHHDARLETARQLAAALGIATSRLMEVGPEKGPDAETTDRWGPTVRALAAPHDPLPELPTVHGVTAALRAALTMSRSAEYGRLAGMLPPLIRDARTLASHVDGGRPVHTRTMQLVGSVLVQHRQFDTAEVVLEQALDRCESHTHAAYTVSTQCWLLLRRGRLHEARQLATRWADDLEPVRITRAAPNDLGAWGWMLLRAAAAAGRDNREGEAEAALRYARVAAEAIGPGRRVHEPLQALGNTFDLSAVRRKEAEHQAVTGRPDRVLAIAERVPFEATNDTRRHLLDVAAAQAAVRQRDEAVATLHRVWREAPEWLAQQHYARETLVEVMRRRRRLSPEMRQLAEAVRLPL